MYIYLFMVWSLKINTYIHTRWMVQRSAYFLVIKINIINYSNCFLPLVICLCRDRTKQGSYANNMNQ